MIEGLNSEDLVCLLAKMGHGGSRLTQEERARFLEIMAQEDLRRQVETSLWKQALALAPTIRTRFEQTSSGVSQT